MSVDIPGNNNISSGFHSTNDLFDAWEKGNRPQPQFIYELTKETEQRLGINIKHGDVIKIENGKITVYGIMYDGGKNRKEIKLDGEVKGIDSLSKVGCSIFKMMPRFQGLHPETFESFMQRFSQIGTTSLPENPSTESDYNDIHLPENKGGNHEFIENPNIGWKLHICVSHTEIQKVYDFLKGKDYYFKCLSGGDGIEKTFTIYAGSLKKSQEIGQELQDIKEYFKRPVGIGAKREIEFGPGILGRFGTSEYSNDFQRYGIVGMDMVKPQDNSKNYLSKLNRNKIGLTDPNLIQQAQLTFQVLSSIFGAYFHG